MLKKDEERLQNYLNQQKMTDLEEKVKMLDQKLFELSNLEMDDNPAAVISSPEVEDDSEEDSSYGNIEDYLHSKKTAPDALKQTQDLKGFKPSNGGNPFDCQFLDVSEGKMRNFVMDQLRRFDVRMEYDGEIFHGSKFVLDPTEA